MKYFFIGIAVIVVDQITKMLVRSYILLDESIYSIGNFFSITHIENRGAAFSVLSGSRIFLVIFPIVIICVGIKYLREYMSAHWSFPFSLTLIISGGLGNLIDRIFRGSVTDMISFSFFPPVFNIADIGVTLGCAILCYSIIFKVKN